MPILHHLIQNKDVIYFLDDTYTLEDHNTYTFLTGKNAIGKSRLLRSIIIHCIKNSIFDRTVALSNTQYHKFPNYSDIQNINKNYINYLKLAFSDRNSSTINEQSAYDSNLNLIYDFFIEHNIKTFDTKHTTLNLLKSFEYLIIKLSKNEKSYNSLKHVLSYLKFDEKIIFEITTSASLSEIRNIIKLYARNKIHKNSEFYNQLSLLQSCIFDIGRERKFTLLNSNFYFYESFGILLELGLIKINNVIFSKNKEKIKFIDLSSGELSSLSLILTLIYAIEDNSLICIDEPEINLHPEWQKNIIKIIEIVVEKYFGCHVFISTHSPQVISGATTKDTFVLELSNKSIDNISKFRNKSSDFQLSEVFNFPGNNNEYLIRKLVLILNKINTETDFVLDKESLSLLEHLSNLIKNEKIDKDDKVFILFNLIKSFRG